MDKKKRVLVFIVCYNAEKFIEFVLERIPAEFLDNRAFEVEILIIDDQSSDATFNRALAYTHLHGQTQIKVLYNPINQGYGGNQKIGYHYAIEQGFDIVVLLHGDGQYAPEMLPKMVQPILTGEADVVLGSRMIDKGSALKGGMPLYKWFGNQILTWMQNKILHTHLSEFHTGFRAYRVQALACIPFENNSNYFDFDTDILIQLFNIHSRVVEIPIPTYYGDEISRVNGLYYAFLIIKTSILSRVVRLGIFYHAKFVYEPTNTHYTLKLGYPSSHQFALDHVPPGARVLDIGSGPGLMAQELARKGAQVTSIDHYIDARVQQYSFTAIQADIDSYDFATAAVNVDCILALDIIEHLHYPEAFLSKVRQAYCIYSPRMVITTGNVAFLPLRLGLLFGQFNYGKRGILDLTHTRLFTFQSLRRILIQTGYRIHEVKGIPAPFPLALGDNGLAKIMMTANRLLIKISKSIFSYQIACIVEPLPTLSMLLKNAEEASTKKREYRKDEHNRDGL